MNKITLQANVNSDTCKHEWIADISSFIAVLLLFGSVFAIMRYHHVTLEWIQGRSLVQNMLAYLFVIADAVLIVSLLCFGPSCHANNKSCMGAFKGRRR